MSEPASMSCELSQEHLAAYVLDSLTGEEAIAVRSHLEHCAACRKEAEELLAVTAALGGAVEEVVPPPALRQRILAQAALTPQLLPQGQPRRSPGSRLRSPAGAWATAAVAAAVALAAIGWGAWEHANPSPAQAKLGGQLHPVSSRQVGHLVADGQSSVISLTAPGAGRAKGLLAVDLQTGVTYLVVSGVPPEDHRSVYTLWYMAIQNGSLLPVNIGDLTAAGAYRLPRSPFGYTRLAVTLEPGPHDSTPRGPVIVSGSLA